MAERVYVALDLETTGLDASLDRIIEIGAVKFRGDHVVERFSTLVNPLRPIPTRITQITGIRDADVAGAPTIERVLPDLIGFVGPDVSAVIAHNKAFDLGFLETAGVRFHRPAYDTVELAMILLPGAASYSLGELCLRLDIPLVDAHRALEDAEATGALFRLLRRRMFDLPAPILRVIAESAEHSEWSLAGFFAEGAERAGEGTVAAPDQPVTGVDGRAADSGAGRAGYTGEALQLYPYAPEGDDVAPNGGADSGDVDDDWPPVPISRQFVEELFRESGALQQLLGPAFEYRPGQASMALQVTDAFNQRDHLLIEAGTGTGKSLAYLLPAALWAIANDSRVVVATNTINLQEQLLDKDIPQVAALLANRGLPPLRAALLKGRQHYLCTRRVHEWRTSHRLSPVELTLLAKVLVWLRTTQTGDDAELALFGSAERSIWLRLCSDGATCSLERCGRPLGAALGLPDLDFYLAARRRSEQAHIIVVNHALLLADLAGDGRVLPPYTHLVVDETHRLEEAATEQLTFRVVWPTVGEALARLYREGDLLGQLHRAAADRSLPVLDLLPDVAVSARRCAKQLGVFVDLLATFARAHEQARGDAGYVQRLALDGSARSQPMWSRIEIEWDEVSRVLRHLVEQLNRISTLLEQAHWREDERTYDLFFEWRAVTDQLADIAVRLDDILLAPRGVEHRAVAWMEVGSEGEGVALAMAPLSVQSLIEEGVVRRCASAVFTGATLRTGANFSYLRERLGLWDVKASTVDSPFDYKRNVLLYLPGDMPLPNEGRYQQAVEQATIAASMACQGRTLALFTSFQQLRITADAIRAPLERMGVTVFQHGQSSRSRLLREFRACEQAILLGTRSFWEGVDLPGDEVRCLLIARLPFAVPSDPMVAARSAEFEDSFNDFMVPDAVLRFRQGFGRLIRRAGDRGVVVLLDSRVWRKAYGQTFLDALPECTHRRAPLSNLGEAVSSWLNRRT